MLGVVARRGNGLHYHSTACSVYILLLPVPSSWPWYI